MTRRLLVGLLAAACVVTGSRAVLGQGVAPEPAPERLPRAEVLRLFDAYAVVQAQDALGLDNASYGSFVSAYKALLETRRRFREQRVRMVADLARAVRRPGAVPDEAQVRDRLKALQDHDTRAMTEAAQALDAVDRALTVVQQAQFRVFEEQMEQRKLDLLSRARAARGAGRGMRP
jgi:hypothetical protein